MKMVSEVHLLWLSFPRLAYTGREILYSPSGDAPGGS